MTAAEAAALAAEIARTLPEWMVRVERNIANTLDWAVLIRRSPDPVETWFLSRTAWEYWLHRHGIAQVAA